MMLLWALLPGLLGAAGVDLQLSGALQLRGGYTQTPLIFAPDNAPLLNISGQAQGTAVATMIVTPGVQLGVNKTRTAFHLTYQPRLYLDFSQLKQQGVNVYHRLATDLTYGSNDKFLLSLTGLVSVGGLDIGQAGSVAQEFTGTVLSKTSASALQYFNAGASLKIELSLNQKVRFITQEGASRYDIPPSSPIDYVNLSLPTAASGAAPVGQGTLRSQTRFDCLEQFNFTLTQQHNLTVDTLFNMVNFAAAATYIGVTPTASWKWKVSSLSQSEARLGFLRYWTNPFPGVFERAKQLLVAEWNLTHRFANWGIPRLIGTLALVTGPYYDITSGFLVPRSSVSVGGNVSLSRKWSLQLSLRDYTPEYWLFGWRPLPPGYTKNILVLNGQAGFRVNRYLQLNAGFFGSIAWNLPSTTLGYNNTKQIYAYIGLDSSYDVH